MPAAPRSFARHIASKRALFAFLVGPSLSGCTTWSSRDSLPTDVLRPESEEAVRITSEGGSTVLREIRIEGDSLSGFNEACWKALGDHAPGCSRERFAVDDIHRYGVRGISAITVVPFLTALVFGVVALSGGPM